MFSPPSKPTFRGMADEQPASVRVSLELEPDTDPIAGSCTHEGGATERFVGWLGLMAALEQARAAVRREDTNQRKDKREASC